MNELLNNPRCGAARRAAPHPSSPRFAGRGEAERPAAARFIGKDGGAALLVGLIVLMLITLLAVSGVRMSMGGLRGAVNEELRVDAFHRAQSLIDGTLSIPANTAVVGLAGELSCLPKVAGLPDGTLCKRNELTLPDMPVKGYAPLIASGTIVAVRRLAPEQTPPPRTSGYSAVKFQSTHMQVESVYDETGSGWGRAALEEGVAVIIPNPGG